MASEKIKIALISAVATVIVGMIPVLLGLVHVSGSDPALRFPVAVLDASNGYGAIAGAEVSLNLPEISSDHTDSAGKFTFQLSKKIIGKTARLTVQKAQYESYDEQILSLQPRDDTYRVLLKRVGSNSSTTTNQPAEVIRVYNSGPKASGSGANFSDWYRLCSAEQPGYKIARSEFRLSGDRVCNAWSECRLQSQTPAEVCWQFRMQGHNEWGGSGQALSEGVLTVVWGKEQAGSS